jgi:azurin
MSRSLTMIAATALSLGGAALIAVALRARPAEPAAEHDASAHAAPAAEPPVPAAVAAPGERARRVHLSGLDNMTFTETTIAARPGELVEIELHAMSGLPPDLLKHNFVLLDPEVSVNGFIQVAAMARDSAHVPPALRQHVVAATGLARAGETVTTTFRAPATPGRYPFVCSFPGHFAAGMKGVLIVE